MKHVLLGWFLCYNLFITTNTALKHVHEIRIWYTSSVYVHTEIDLLNVCAYKSHDMSYIFLDIVHVHIFYSTYDIYILFAHCIYIEDYA